MLLSSASRVFPATQVPTRCAGLPLRTRGSPSALSCCDSTRTDLSEEVLCWHLREVGTVFRGDRLRFLGRLGLCLGEGLRQVGLVHPCGFRSLVGLLHGVLEGFSLSIDG